MMYIFIYIHIVESENDQSFFDFDFFFLPALGEGLWVLGVYALYPFFLFLSSASLFKSRDYMNFSYSFYSSFILSYSFYSSNDFITSSYFYSNSSSSYNMYGYYTNSSRVTLFVGSFYIIYLITSLPSYVSGWFLGNRTGSFLIYRTNSFSLSWMNGSVPYTIA